MNNFAIARVFARIADLMELQGENVFKIKAYRSAARTMQELTESLEVLAERGELQRIPGVGETIAQKTRDILATGSTPLYEELRVEVPETLIELLAMPGFGTRKIQAVWRELDVRNLEDLERAAREGRLRALSGFTARTEETLLQAIAAHRARRQRVPIGEALPYAEALAGMLRDDCGLARVEIAGSLRRRQDTVGDIDLLAGASDPEAALAAAAAHPELESVIERRAGLLSARTAGGICVDLRVALPSEVDGLLLEWTGSAAHLEQLAALPAAGGSLPAALDEQSAYGRLELAWIPPELREGRGELEAAAARRLPHLIEEADYRGVLHAHSTWSDGSTSIAGMAAAARRLGHAYLAITDHSHSLTVAGGLDEVRLREQMEEIRGVNAGFDGKFRVYRGIECDILADGTLDLPLELLAELDFVIGSVHMHQRQDEETMTARVLRALESGVLHLLAHPTGRILGMRDPYGLDMERVMAAARARRVAMEINAFPDRLDLHDVHARQARDSGVLISINPDAHRPEHLALLRYGIGQARRAWLEPRDVINTWSPEELEAWLPRR